MYVQDILKISKKRVGPFYESFFFFAHTFPFLWRSKVVDADEEEDELISLRKLCSRHHDLVNC
jgi:hypothetical protein